MFQDIVTTEGLQYRQLTWTQDSSSDELDTLVKKYLLLRAKKAFTASTSECFEGYRRRIAEVDPVNRRTLQPN